MKIMQTRNLAFDVILEGVQIRAVLKHGLVYHVPSFVENPGCVSYPKALLGMLMSRSAETSAKKGGMSKKV